MENDFSYFLFFLQLITNVNIAVVVEVVQALGNLASGLRTNFSASSRFVLPVLLVSLHSIMILNWSNCRK